MKTRLDFVTNSSSSSFIICIKGVPEVEQSVLDKYPCIKNYVTKLEQIITNGSNQVLRNAAELDDFFLNYYGWGVPMEELLAEEPSLAEVYDDYSRRIADGYTIFIREVDYNDEGTRYFLETLKDSGDTIIMENY